ncbi:hypothetical protein GA0115240_12013, partial [Streptomyces sp. DvalAA-14]
MTAAPGTVAPTATGDPVHPHVPPPADDRAAHWYPAQGLLHRGTVVLLPGRGEHPGVYERFGRRLAADAYVVHVLDVPPEAGPAEVAAGVDAVAEGAAAPLVLAGSDTGGAAGAGGGGPYRGRAARAAARRCAGRRRVVRGRRAG